jgi:hypothetical protein
MFLALVDHFQPHGGESRLEPVAHFLRNTHLFPTYPFLLPSR